MLLYDFSQTFLFTFRPNGQAEGKELAEVLVEQLAEVLVEQLAEVLVEQLAEVLVEQLADYDPSVAADSYKRSWFGTADALDFMLATLGFESTDIEGVMAALKSHRTVDRKFAVTPDQPHQAGFQELA